MTHHARLVPVVISLIGVMSGAAQAQYALRRAVDGRPDATIDLRTRDGAALVCGQWRYADARLTEVEALGPGADLKPTGRPVRTYDQVLKAGAIDFDDSEWNAIEAPSLEERRSTGKFSFAWYRFNLTVPESVGGLATRGTTMVFEIVVDDYAEIWVDGQLPRTLGQTGGSLVKGFNAPNRVVLTRDAQPGQRIQLAVFAANGPLSDPPPNFIWVRSASLDFYKPGATTAPSTAATIMRVDPGLDTIVPAGARIEHLAGGFLFTEGPVWVPDGYLLFSDPNANTIYRWSDDDGLSVYRTKSGYTGSRYRRVRTTGIERAGARCRWAAHHQRARQSTCDAPREERHADRPRRSLRRQATEQPQRSRLRSRRLAVLHRSAVRPAEGVRRSAQGAGLQRRVSMVETARCSW